MLTFAAMPPAVIEAVMSARQEARVRSTLDDSVPVAIDTETWPSGSLQLRTRGARAFVTYAPRITGRDLNLDASGLFLIISLIIGGFALRRARRGDGAGSASTRVATVLVSIMLVAYLVAIWAMTVKPG